MCGIAGFVGQGDAETLSRMIGRIGYRGPDDKGVWHEGNIGLAHARLSIIDLSPSGHQPMQNADGTVTIVFNGEIYNYRELREELKKRGRTFRSTSDTEVIIQLYDAYGEGAFARLEGMFTFALYDGKKKTLFLARDRMGEKPLYYTLAHGTLVFASEPKALFEHPLVPRELDSSAVTAYLTFDAVLTPQSFFKSVHKLEAATYIVYAQGKLTKHSYWTPPAQADDTMTFVDASLRLDQALEKSIARQMVADVPVGIFLSGGFDSSTIAYYAMKKRSKPVHTFSIGFEEPSYDESRYARMVAEYLGTTHHEYRVTPREMQESVINVLGKLDEPIADPAIVPTHLLSCFAREQVTVVLGGEGSDELFLGYPTFFAQKFSHLYRFTPAMARTLIKQVASALPVSHRYFSFDFKVRQFLRGVDAPEKYMHQAWLQSFDAAEQQELLAPAYRTTNDSYRRIDEYLAEMPDADAYLQASYFYLRTYLLDVLLAKVDRASMYCALEVRAPFLDKEVVELALSMPHQFKHRGRTGKYIVRELMKDRLPQTIVRRGKHGFGLPVGGWFRNEWKSLLLDVLSGENIRKVGICSPPAVDRLITEHLDGTHNHRKKLWSLLVLHLWHNTWMQ